MSCSARTRTRLGSSHLQTVKLNDPKNNHHVYIMGEFRGGRTGGPEPLPKENHKWLYVGFLRNTCANPLEGGSYGPL